MKGAKAIRPALPGEQLVLAHTVRKAVGSFAVPSLVTVLRLAASSAQAITPIRFSGELGGLVTDIAGKPQPGAVVLLYNKQDVLLQRSSTDALGTFAFGELLPDLYSVNVSLSNFVPALK